MIDGFDYFILNVQDYYAITRISSLSRYIDGIAVYVRK